MRGKGEVALTTTTIETIAGRYAQAAADYLGLPVDHPRIVRAARKAQKIAENRRHTIFL